ncbi:MAG: adenine nucleotide alpha hydrolase family protein [Chloroflexi bacterium]|nr:adenine nucleotide alpha hydrolase family protein [Chloroflexota bacterium]
MKCDQCGGVAVIGMPQHRLHLCAEHFLAWVPRMVERTIRRYQMFTHDECVLVAVSGGKDSLSLWEILIELGYQTEGLYINLGIAHEDYSDVSQRHVEAFAARHGGLPLRIVDVRREYGRGIPDLGKTGRGRRMCSACGLVKRHIMNRVAREGGYAAIATGHNLDDEAAVLLQNTLHWQGSYLRRQAPVLPASHPGLARKVKPLCHLYERETAAYALVKEISFVELECPYSVRATTIFYKELLNRLERHSRGAKQQFYLSFLKAREEGLFAPEPESAPELGECRACGQPTTAGELCAFCRLWQAMEEHDD